MNNVSYYLYSLSVQSQGGDLAFSPRGWGQGGKSTNSRGGFAPRSNLLPFLNTLFGEKGPLFVYLLLITITLFTYLV